MRLRRGRILPWLLGAAAAIAGLVAGGGLLGLVPVPLLWAVPLHLVAAGLVGVSAGAFGAGVAERMALVGAALALPGFGPALAWVPRRLPSAGERVNAHAVFERFEIDKSDALPRLSGHRGRDLARELGVSSHAQILRHGSLERRRNLLRTLARMGGPRHLAVLRQCLRDPEPELRLCAYAELDKLSRIHERQMAALRTEVQELEAQSASRGAAADLLAALAEANRRYAGSGILDPDMSRYWLQQAAKIASQALELLPDQAGALRTKALALAELGELDEAWSCLQALPLAEASRPEALLARAEIAFRRRDFEAVRAAGAGLAAAGSPLPGWLQAVCGEGAEAVAGAGGMR